MIIERPNKIQQASTEYLSNLSSSLAAITPACTLFIEANIAIVKVLKIYIKVFIIVVFIHIPK
jgi:hypothetical protein